MKWTLCAALFLSQTLFCAERVEVSLNGVMSESSFRSIFEHTKLEVRLFDLKNYPQLFKEKGGKKGKKRHPAHIAVDRELTHCIFLNIPIKQERGIAFNRLPNDKTVLFMFEPPLRLRKMYGQKVQAAFGRIYTFDDDLIDNKKYFKFHYPVLQPMIEEVVPFEQKKLCCLIAAWASDKIKSPEELYSERKKVIGFFEKNHLQEFDFYGRNWSADEFPSYRGPIPDKTEVMKKYRFAFTYENSRSLKGYVTEKIFDAFAAGCVPIYWGAPNIEEYIPKNCFIDKRDFATLEELYTFIQTMPREKYEAYLDAIRAYLKSEQAQKFSWNAFRATVLEAALPVMK